MGTIEVVDFDELEAGRPANLYGLQGFDAVQQAFSRYLEILPFFYHAGRTSCSHFFSRDILSSRQYSL